MAIKMTETAARLLKAVLSSKSLPESTMLRVDVEGGEAEGESRLVLRLDTQEPGEDDEVETTEGARLVVHKELARELGDLQIDFRKDGGGFVFKRAEPAE